jgi:DNA-3-methyladenine glycosylase II
MLNVTNTTRRTMQPLGPYSLAEQSRYFGGWTTSVEDGSIVMAFPVEGWHGSAAVSVRQDETGGITGEVTGGDAGAAWKQALEALSLDIDGSGYAEVGERDPVIGGLQREHAFLRPVLFHSPYEAACGFVIGLRIRIAQSRAIRQRIAEQHGEAFTIAGADVHAFPTPQRLLEVKEIGGINAEKVDRLHGIARAALDGRLDRDRLRSLPPEEALTDVRGLRGIGEFFASGIVLRGAGLVDEIPADDITRDGVKRFYGLSSRPSVDEFRDLAEVWRPYRTWCSVLIHASERRARG